MAKHQVEIEPIIAPRREVERDGLVGLAKVAAACSGAVVGVLMVLVALALAVLLMGLGIAILLIVGVIGD